MLAGRATNLLRLEDVKDILSSCEQSGLTRPYFVNPDTYKEERGTFMSASYPMITDPVLFPSKQEEIFVISDLHIASGRNVLGVYQGTENFFADQAMERFLAYAAGSIRTRSALLVINGDTFDFLRVTDYPGKVIKRGKRLQDEIDADFLDWQEALGRLGIQKTVMQLVQSISSREKTYGLETDDYKTIYKLMKIREGHPGFFEALGDWLSRGHRILILKGNHDLELIWPAVRHYIRLLLAESVGGASLAATLVHTVLPRLSFADDAVLIDDTLYLEHGHRYDKFAMVLGSPVLPQQPTEINIPFGSFFNRYLINRVELYLPYLDKVRPVGNIIPILVRDNFPLALKIFGSQVPFVVRTLFTNGRYIWFMLRRVLPLLLALIPIVVFLLAAFWSTITGDIKKADDLTGIDKTVLQAVESIGAMILSYWLARLIGWLQLEEPSSLNDFAHRLFVRTEQKYRIMSMGHTHNPGSYLNDARSAFYNTGTWIPVIETATAEVREDGTYTFLHLVRDPQDRLIAMKDQLQRWNDDAGRPDPQLLIRQK
jgi:UDP-2,3-diacylglucosamine pyrophosphatase LpxH